jgi:hypothetical protein
LFYIELRFIHPGEMALHSVPSKISAFMGCPYRNWCTCRQKCSITMLQAVQHCETPSEALPPSDKPCAAHPLNIDYSDLCGPFPIMTPHGKHHFVISLDDQSNHLNLQLLAMKDQALEAWCTIKNHWENHLE